MMRTTITIEDDVAAVLGRLQKSRDVSLKALINDALRRGIREIEAPTKPHEPFRTKAVRLGQPSIPLDNIAEALAIAEGEWHR